VFVDIPSRATQSFGPPSPRLTVKQRIQYSAQLLWYNGLLTNPLNPNGTEQSFIVEQDESVYSIANRLEVTGFIQSADAFRSYLIYTGLDTSIQAGEYQFSTAMSAIDIANRLQDATSDEVEFVVLPGWRMEEVAASLSTSGLPIAPEGFILAGNDPSRGYDFLTGARTVEGFLSPGTYIVSRQIDAEGLVENLVRTFAQRLTRELTLGFEDQGLTVYQAVTLASIVQREAVHEEEAPRIASVYINRLRSDIKLEADPTVQYAVGFNSLQDTWWTNPLSASDLQIDSPFNTYVYEGLPPSPIANPGMAALQAVGYPEETDYLFFRAMCDGSGYHAFAYTFEEHVANGCQ